MVILRNKLFRIFISLLMIVIILFSFTIKPYAEAFVLSGLALKVFVTALASAGILLTAQSFEGGVSGLYEGFKNYMETVKDISNIGSILAKAGINSIYNNAKMKLNNLFVEETGQTLNMTNILTDYIGSLNASLPQTEVIDTIPGSYFDHILNYSGRASGLPRVLRKEVEIGSGYTLRSEINNYTNIYVQYIKKDGKIIDINRIYDSDNLEVIPEPIDDYGEISVQIRRQISDGFLYFDIYGYSHTLNKAINNRITIPFENLIGLDTTPTFENWRNKGFSTPQAIPNEIAFPWGLTDVDIPSYIGDKTLDELLEGINHMPLNPYIEGLGNLTKEQIDSFPVTQVDTDAEGIITDVDVPDVPGVQAPDIDLDVPIGLLGSIAGFLKNIWEWLQNMFSVPDDIGLDFTPLQSIIPKEKFPFSIPWDYANLIGLFKSDPIPPKFEIEILNEELVIDFTQFEMWAKITRNTLSVIFLVGLMFSTRKLMIGGS